MKNLIESTDIQEEERRIFERYDIRSGDGFEAALKSTEKPIKIQVYDLSNAGISFLINKKDFNISLYDILSIELKTGATPQSEFNVCIQNIQIFNQEKMKVGAKIIQNKFNQAITTESNYSILELNNLVPLCGYFFNPLSFFEKTLFQINKLSLDFIEIKILNTSHLLFKGNILDLHFHLDNGKTFNLNTTIRDVSQGNKHFTVCCKINTFPKATQIALSQFLFDFSNVSLQEIKKSGIKVLNISSSIRLKYSKTEKDYLKVLELRHKAYSHANKVGENSTPEDMKCRTDKISRILTFHHGEKMIASVALAFPPNNAWILETEEPFIKTKLSKQIPKKTDSVEICRLCIDPSYQGADIYFKIFSYIYKVLISSNRNFLVSSTDEKLWKVYKKIGFKKLKGLKYNHQSFGTEHHVMIIKSTWVLKVQTFALITWTFFYREMTKHLVSLKIYEPTFFDKFKYRVSDFIAFILIKK